MSDDDDDSIFGSDDDILGDDPSEDSVMDIVDSGIYEDEDDQEEEVCEAGSCFVCGLVDVPEEDRWKFAVAALYDREQFWACKSCRAKFKSLEDFDEFRTNLAYSNLYRAAARLQRLILQKAPESVITDVTFALVGILFMGESETLKKHAAEELKIRYNRIFGEKK